MIKSRTAIVLSAAMLLTSCGVLDLSKGSSSTISSESSVTSNESSVTTSSSKETSQSSSSGLISSSSPVSSSSSEEPDTGISFDMFAKLISSAAYNEATLCSGGTYKSVDVAGNITDTLEYSLDIFADWSSYSTGTVKETYASGEVICEDEFIERKDIKADKIRDLDNVLDYEMLYTVRDYKNDAFVKYAYQDSASRIFVTNGQAEDGVSITATEAKWGLTLKATDEIISFFDQYFYSSIYAEQLGIRSLEETVTDTGVTYSVKCEYTLDGDLNDRITYVSQLEVNMNAKKDRVLGFKTLTSSDDVSKVNSNDRYLSSTSKEVTLKYEKKATEYDESIPDVRDYFLATVSSINILDASRKECDPLAVSPSAGVLHIVPKEYSPAKTIGIKNFSLTPVESSDETIVKVAGSETNPYFSVVGTGEVSLTYSYYGLDDEGIYTEVRNTVDIKVRDIDYPEYIAVNYFTDVETKETISSNAPATLCLGKTYSTFVQVKAGRDAWQNKAPQDVKISLSDESVISYTYDKGNMVITPLKAGTTTMRIESKDFPDVNWEIELTVVDNTKTDYESLLTTGKWKYESPYGGTYVLQFLKGGTGKMFETTASGSEYEETFKWVLDGETIKTSDWSYDYKFENGLFTPNLDGVSFEVESAYKSYIFKHID